jgi:hypothetical protein
MSQRQKFHKACIKLKTNVEESTILPFGGICSNLPDIDVSMACDFVEKYAKTWKHFSGSETYPVPGRHAAYRAAHDTGSMWTGEYGELRKDLLDHLIEQSKYSDFDRFISRIKSYFNK